MRAPNIPSSRFVLPALALLSLMSVHCGGDDSGNNPTPGSDASTPHDAGFDGSPGSLVDAGKDSSTPGSANDGSTPATPDASASGPDAATSDASTPDAAAPDAAAPDASTPSDTIPTLNGCKPTDYVDVSAANASRAITIDGSNLRYMPPCITIAAGQSVSWNGSLSGHPLAPGVDSKTTGTGSANNPIQATSTGTTVSFTFPTAGTYPYKCTKHVELGMVGSIHVK